MSTEYDWRNARPGWHFIDMGPTFWLDQILPTGEWLVYSPGVGEMWAWDGGDDEPIIPTLQFPTMMAFPLDEPPAWSERLVSLLSTSSVSLPVAPEGTRWALISDEIHNIATNPAEFFSGVTWDALAQHMATFIGEYAALNPESETP